jgi:hypothetical protein
MGDLLTHLCAPRSWCDRAVAVAHNARGCDAQFILQRAILLKWKRDLILNGSKIMSMRMEHLLFIDSVSFLPMSLRKLPEAFQLSARKSWYPYFFNTRENLNYVGHIPDIALYGVDAMSVSESQEFMPWYEKQKDQVFDKRRSLEDYCQVDLTVLREACTIFRRDFIEIGNIEFFSRQ